MKSYEDKVNKNLVLIRGRIYNTRYSVKLTEVLKKLSVRPYKFEELRREMRKSYCNLRTMIRNLESNGFVVSWGRPLQVRIADVLKDYEVEFG